MEIVIVDLEDLDFAKMGAIGWILLVLATIVTIKIRLVLILHLEAKYAKMNCKNEIYMKN